MNLTRITRLLKLLQTLQAGQGDNADGLAKACGVSRRTAFRDLETLRAAGVPLTFDKASSRYSIAGDYFLRPTNFSSAEALAIVALTQEFGAERDLPFYGAARSAALKIQETLPTPLRREVQHLSRSIHIRLNPVDRLAGAEHVFEQMLQSISQRQVAAIRYQSLTEWEPIDSKLRPYQLLYNRHSWYVIGRSSFHGATRTFNLGRISSIELLPQRYARPRGLSIERYLGNAWNIMPQAGPDENVVIRFAPMVAKNVSEVNWHKTQRVEWLEDGSIDFHVRVSGLSEIVWWILGYGDQAEVLRPAKLRKLVAQRVRNCRQLYADATDPPRSGPGPRHGSRLKQR